MRCLFYVLFYLPICLSAECPKACTTNADCGGTPEAAMCCVSGFCQSARLLPDGAACSIGRTQDQVCAAEGGGQCAAGPGFLIGLVPLESGNPDSLCIDNVCRFVEASKFQPDANCACTNSSQCAGGAVCDETCLSGDKKVGEACISNQQCVHNPVCEQGVCVGLPLNASCEFYWCAGSGCSDACAKPYKCLESTSTCGMPIEEGAGCNVDGDCKVGMYCVSGKCSKGATAGQTCTNALFSEPPLPLCAGGHFCDLRASPNVCKTLYSRPSGEPCYQHNECQSKSCKGADEASRTCFGGNVTGSPCNSNGLTECGESFTCDCATKQCVPINPSSVCYAETAAFSKLVSDAFTDGTSAANADSIALDFVCCQGCKAGEYASSLKTVDCATRTLSSPANPCTDRARPVLRGCDRWAPGAAPKGAQYSGASQLSVKIGIVIFVSLLF